LPKIWALLYAAAQKMGVESTDFGGITPESSDWRFCLVKEGWGLWGEICPNLGP
jgi:hypothetical protein